MELLHDAIEIGHIVWHHLPEIVGGFLGYLVHEWKHVAFRAVKHAVKRGH